LHCSLSSSLVSGGNKSPTPEFSSEHISTLSPRGIELTTKGDLVGQVIFKNVGKLPATELVRVVEKIEVHDADWVTPGLTDADLPSEKGVIPIGAKVREGSAGITLNEVNQAQVSGDKYLYVWGRAKFKDGFGSDRYVNFCHRYAWAKALAAGKSRRGLPAIISTATSQTEPQ
jgi:hypothetical protein